jgi:hypothetical protein
MALAHIVPTKVVAIDEKVDEVFICCNSFEPRTTSAARELDPKYLASRAIICRGDTYLDKGKTAAHLEFLTQTLRKRSREEPVELVFQYGNPVHFIQQFDQHFRSAVSSCRTANVTVDISTFPRQELLLLLRYLDRQPSRGEIRLLYGEPQKYATELRDPSKAWLTAGVKSVRAVPGFCGLQSPQRRKLLVLVLGHEGERMQITLRRHQPDRVIFVTQSDQQLHGGLREIVDRQNARLLEEFGSETIYRQSVSATGVLETRDALLALFSEYRHEYNLFFALGGTKLQLVGGYLAVRTFDEVQITYATPAVYNWKYFSSGRGPLWEARLPPPENNP